MRKRGKRKPQFVPINLYLPKEVIGQRVEIKSGRGKIYVGEIVAVEESTIYLYDGSAPLPIFLWGSDTKVRI